MNRGESSSDRTSPPAHLAESRAAYLGEIDRLRTLIIETADDLGLVEEALVAVCQHATDENLDQRVALLELRTLIANLNASGRAHPLDFDGDRMEP